VSTQAQAWETGVSPCVDHVCYVEDGSWAGRLPDSDTRSPTSTVMVEVSEAIIGVGGDLVARDEMLAARAAGKPVHFFPADMKHHKAIEAAAKRGHPAPDDFSSAAATAFAHTQDA